MPEVMKRREAAERGLKRYYTGRPCSKGHDSQRFTATGVCIMCAAGYTKEYQSRMRKTVNSARAGIFTYPLHPEDHAVALAYCQALDLQRGRVPQVPGESSVAPVGPMVLPEHIARHREQLLANFSQPAGEIYLPKP